MNNKEMKKIMREQFAPSSAEPIELPQDIQSRIENLSSHSSENTYKRRPIRAIIALSVSFVMILGIVLPVVLSIGSVGGGWRNSIVNNVKNAQFTPNYDLIVYNPNKVLAEQIVNTNVSSGGDSSSTPLNTFAVSATSEPLVRIAAEDIKRSSVAYGLTDKDWIQNQTEINKEFALYCVQNVAETGVWQKLDIWGGITGMFKSGIGGLTQVETYAMFTVSDDGVIDIFAQTDGIWSWDNSYGAEEGAYAYIKKRMTIDPHNDTVETWSEQSEIFTRELYSSQCPYIFVKKDVNFLIAYEVDYSKHTSEYEHRSKMIWVEEYSRAGDSHFGVSASISYVNDGETGGTKLFGANVVLSYAKGENYTYYVLNNDRVDFSELYSVYCGTDKWNFFVDRVINNIKSGGENIRVEDMWAVIDLTALSGIKAYYADFTPNKYGLYPVKKIELYDGTVFDEKSMPMLAGSTFSMDTPEYMVFPTKTLGRLSVNRRYINEIPLYSEALNSVSFPAGISYKNDVDFTVVDNIERIVKGASVWGIENPYENPEKIAEKLNGFGQKELAFTIEK